MPVFPAVIFVLLAAFLAALRAVETTFVVHHPTVDVTRHEQPVPIRGDVRGIEIVNDLFPPTALAVAFQRDGASDRHD